MSVLIGAYRSSSATNVTSIQGNFILSAMQYNMQCILYTDNIFKFPALLGELL